MQAIRSILWIGPYEGLVQNGLMQAEHLDVVWVRDVDAVFDLPVASFEAAVIALDDAQQQVDAVTRCAGHKGMPPLLILVASGDAESIRDRMPLGGGEVVVAETLSDGPPFIAELNNRIESVAATRSAVAGLAPSNRHFPSPQTMDPEIIGQSEAIRAAYELAERAACGTTTVLLHGETGTGKEVFAKAIHRLSDRASERFVAINCAAIPDTLLESELFGHMRGSFTGATSNKTGLFELARGGTLFLDEIAETSISLQAKLLRAIQEREIRPVGGNRDHKIDVRIVAASNRDLRVEAARGAFREDLYYRLAVFPISIPPLRKRAGDIVLIAQHFLRKYGSSTDESRTVGPPNELSQSAAELLLTYPWPGNVRELENEIQRAVMLAEPGQLLTPNELSESISNAATPVASEEHIGKTLREIVAQVEAQVIRRTLAKNEGRRARSARELGITREGLYKKMKRLGVE